MTGSRNGVLALIKREYAHAHFMRFYAHQLNLVAKRMCSDIALARIFFGSVFGSFQFFRVLIKTSKLAESRVQTCASLLCANTGIASRVLFEA